MTVGPRSQCHACVHFRGRQSYSMPLSCDAFPSGIPDKVFTNQVDHRRPIGGDHGVRFEAKDGDRFPVYAFIGE